MYLCYTECAPQVATTDGVRNVLKQAYHDDDQVATHTHTHLYTHISQNMHTDLGHSHLYTNSWLAHEIVEACFSSVGGSCATQTPTADMYVCMSLCWMWGR